MKGQLRYRHLGRSAVALLLAAAASLGNAQAFNVDLDIFTGTAAQGNGAPSSSFGAAANQPGVWNRSAFVGLNQLVDTSGQSTGVTLRCELASGGGIGFFNPINTGDYALLLNDAAQVSAVVPGGTARFTFEGLSASDYLIFTYAVRPQGDYTEAPIRVPEATSNQTQTVTGPMPGNTFEYLVTHSVHLLEIDQSGTILVEVNQQPFTNLPYYVNGFQVVPVPETNSFVVLACSCAVAYGAKRRLGSRGG